MTQINSASVSDTELSQLREGRPVPHRPPEEFVPEQLVGTLTCAALVTYAGEERIVAGLGADNYRRLAAVKRRYDPDNVFHRNHNIKPG